MDELFLILIIFFIILLYFLPTIKAFEKKRKDRIWLFFINLFIGWTILGWFGCLVWVKQDDE